MAHTATITQKTAVRQTSLLRGLSLTDSVLLMVGGIIGSGIFLTAGSIATAVRTPKLFLGVWLDGVYRHPERRSCCSGCGVCRLSRRVSADPGSTCRHRETGRLDADARRS